MKKVHQCLFVLLFLAVSFPAAGQPVKECLVSYNAWQRYKAIDIFYQQANYSFA